MVEQQGRLARLRMDADNRMLGLEFQVTELLPVLLFPDVDAADLRALGSVIARSTLIAGIRSTNVTSVCQLLDLPCSASMGSTPSSPATVG